MPATKSSRRSQTSRNTERDSTASWFEWTFAAFLLAGIGVSAAVFFSFRGYTLYYGDAEAHLNIARRIVDSRTPGPDQIGTVWLPLPHLLMLPFVGSMRLWNTGLAGTIPSIACFVAAGVFLFASSRIAFGSLPAALCTALVFALNPNLLYLASAPMTEAVFFASLGGVLFFSFLSRKTHSLWAAGFAGVFSCAASLTRYEGWFLVPFVCLYLLACGGEQRWKLAVLFGVIASLAPLSWLAHNWFYFGDALEFYRGPYAPKAQNKNYPGSQDWGKAWLYFRYAAQLVVGMNLAWIGVAGTLAALVKRAFWPVALLVLLPVFYILSMYSSGTPIFVPQLWTKSYYNTRYGLAVLPLFAVAAGGLVALVPEKLRAGAAGAVVLLAVIPWLIHPAPQNWICWKESEVNSRSRRAWTQEAAEYLKTHYKAGDGILFGFGDLAAVLREAQIPLREGLHDGNAPQFDAAVARPDLFVNQKWALAITGDRVSMAMLQLIKSGKPYERVKLIESKDAPAVEIYRRPRMRPVP